MSTDPRVLAAKILQRCGDRRLEARAVDLLDKVLAAHPEMDGRDRGLITELVYGVLRWQLRLDHALSAAVTQKFSKLEPLAKVLLRLGAYQLFFLDRVPAHAAVDGSLRAAKILGGNRFTGLLNAVLRRLAADGEPTITGMGDKSIAARTALPLWMIRELRYLSQAPQDLEALAAGLRRRPEVTLRPTASKGGAEVAMAALREEGFEVAPGLAGTMVAGGGDVFGTAAYRNGLFVAQDPASLAVVDVAGEVDGAAVLDLCAGRGVKATAFADRGAMVTAVDISETKLAQAAAMAEHLGLSGRLTTQTLDPTKDALAGAPLFDVVVVDAPCSGLGTIARRPEIAWRTAPEALPRLATLQRALVEAAATYVRPGGMLLYAVCTFTGIESKMPAPEGFTTSAQDQFRWRPDDGYDAFYAQRFFRAKSS